MLPSGVLEFSASDVRAKLLNAYQIRCISVDTDFFFPYREETHLGYCEKWECKKYI